MNDIIAKIKQCICVMYRILISLIITFAFFTLYANAAEYSDFKANTQKAFESYDFTEINKIGRQKGINPEEISRETAESSFRPDINSIIKAIVSKLISEVLLQGELMKTILSLCVLCGILKFISSSFSGGTAKMSLYICFIGMVACVSVSFASAGTIVLNTARDLENTLYAAVPLVCGAVIATGGGSGVAVMLPAACMVTEAAVKLTEIFFIPMVNVCGALGIVNHFSEKPILSKLAEYMETVTKWALKGFTALALGILGIYRVGSVSTSQTAFKIIKSGAGAVPVIGDILSGTIQSAAAFGGLVKSGIGVAAVVVIAVCAFFPAAKIIAISAAYRITAALVQPIGEKSITECIDLAGKSAALFLGIIMMLVAVFVTTVTIFISIGETAAVG